MRTVLLIDDFFGRRVGGGEQVHRARLCARLRVVEMAPESQDLGRPEKSVEIGMVFCRGQIPEDARPGDTVQNDLSGTIRRIIDGIAGSGRPWDLVLLDLNFNVGRVTARSMQAFPGMPDASPKADAAENLFGLKILAELKRLQFRGPVAIFSAMDDAKIKSEVRQYEFFAGWLSRLDPEGATRLRGFFPAPEAPTRTSSTTFPELIRYLSEMKLEFPEGIDAPLDALGRAQAQIMRQLLGWALRKTSPRPGIPALLPAMRLLSGRSDLTTPKAADMIKRIVASAGEAGDAVLNDTLVAEAHRRACKLRGGKQFS